MTALIPGNAMLFIDAEGWVRQGGLLLLLILVYCSTGLFFCFFLPIGAVLFVAGALIASGELHYSLLLVCTLSILAAVAGSATGYFFGWKSGPALYRRKDSRLYRKKHLIAAGAFYKKYGWLALTAGLFLPVIRTFAPIVAGIVRMNWWRFVLISFLGSVIWIVSFIAAGYFIASRPFLKPWLKYIVFAFIVLVTVPLVAKTIRELKRSGGK